jgi:hypothetical protein
VYFGGREFMRMGTIDSDLIRKIGHDNGVLRVEYAADGKVFEYENVPLRTFAAIVKSKSPGRKLLEVRDKYAYHEVKG